MALHDIDGLRQGQQRHPFGLREGSLNAKRYGGSPKAFGAGRPNRKEGPIVAPNPRHTHGYDQLNRLKTARQHTAPGTWNNANASANYRETFNYDGNGNIQSLVRRRNGGNFMVLIFSRSNTFSAIVEGVTYNVVRVLGRIA